MQDCLFCKIINGDIPAQKLYEDEQVIAIKDINPKAKVHFLVMPKQHISSVSEITGNDEQLIGHMINVGKIVAKEQGLKGWKMLFNVEKAGGQVIFHVHLHVLGGGQIKLQEC